LHRMMWRRHTCSSFASIPAVYYGRNDAARHKRPQFAVPILAFLRFLMNSS
jgi:hypothetical protein